NAYREDMAAVSLRDKVQAPRYVQGELRQVVGAAAPLRLTPRFDSPLLTEALCGELVLVYDVAQGWGWVQLSEDGYVGYMPMDQLSATIEEPNHWVTARGTYVYPAPDLKRTPIMRLGLGAKITATGREGRFFEMSRGGFIFSGHIQPLEEKAK